MLNQNIKEVVLNQSIAILSAKLEEQKLAVLINNKMNVDDIILEDISVKVKKAENDDYRFYVYSHTFKVGEQNTIVDIFSVGWDSECHLENGYSVNSYEDELEVLAEDNYVDGIELVDLLNEIEYPDLFMKLETLSEFLMYFQNLKKEELFLHTKDILPGLVAVDAYVAGNITLSFSTGAQLTTSEKNILEMLYNFDQKQRK